MRTDTVLWQTRDVKKGGGNLRPCFGDKIVGEKILKVVHFVPAAKQVPTNRGNT